MKNQKVIYKLAVGLLVFLFGFGGLSNVLKMPEAMASLELLGYPDYFASILGVAQIVGVIVLIAPKMERFREMAFFGFFINLASALVSHLVVEGLVPVIGIILFALCVLVAAFFLSLKLQSNHQTS